MPEGFRVAQAYVEVTAHLDEGRLLATARRAGEGLEDALQDHGRRAGSGLTGALERAGADAGQALVRSTEGRLRDARGRFIGAGTKVGEDVRKGAADDFDKGGFRTFLGLVKAAPKAGIEAAGGIVGALSQGLKGPAGPVLIGALSAGAVVAGPIVGGVVAGGILAGIATAGIGAGVILAAKDPEVKRAWTQTGDSIGDILQDSASPFKAELIEAAGRGTAAFERWRPMFREIFGTASTMLDPFVDMVEGIGDRVLPSIMTTMNSARPAVEALTSGVEGTVDAVMDVVDMLGDNGPEAALALRAAFLVIQGAITNAGIAVNFMAEALGGLVEFGLDSLGWIADAGEKLSVIPGPLGDIGGKLAELGPVTDRWRGSWDGLKGGITGATEAGATGTSHLSEQTKLLSLSMGAAIQQAGGLSAAFKLLNGGALSAREAESAYQAAIDNVTASMKQNGATLDLRTAKGRANDAALRQLITTTDQKAQATYDETLATKGAAAAEAAAAGVYATGRDQLIKSARAMGLSKDEAVAYADKLMKIPKSWSTTVSVNDQATGKVTAIKSYINSITGKTVTVRVIETREGHRMPGQGTLTRASGGEITGGSGWRDDVPLLAMGGEWVIQKKAVAALKRQFGPDYMQTLNNWHQGGKGGPGRYYIQGHNWATKRAARQAGQSATPTSSPATGSAPAAPAPVYIGQVTLDASGMKSIQDVVELIGGLSATARSYRAGTAPTAAGV